MTIEPGVQRSFSILFLAPPRYGDQSHVVSPVRGPDLPRKLVTAHVG